MPRLPALLIPVAALLCPQAGAAPRAAWAQAEQVALEQAAPTAAASDPALQALLDRARAESPAVRATHADWQAAVMRVGGAGRLPEPTLSVGVFVQPVETRVGAQQGRVSLQQGTPWPTALGAQRDGAQAQALAARARHDATTLSVTGEVRRRYWTLWEVRAAQRVHRSHLDVLDGLARSLRARVAVGAASLADVQQVDLSRARLADALASMEAAERSAEAAVRAAVGLDPQAPVPTGAEGPPLAVPALDTGALIALAQAHPLLAESTARSAAADAHLRGANAQRLPGFMVGVDWIPTAPAAMPDVEDSGKDAVMVGVGLRLPLWQRSYAAQVSAARATQAAEAARLDGAADRVAAGVVDAAARVRDGARRVRVVERTLLVQAEATYSSLLGAMTVGQASTAQVLLAQRDLLELRIDADRSRSALARAWADLDERCGAPVPRTAPPGDAP